MTSPSARIFLRPAAFLAVLALFVGVEAKADFLYTTSSSPSTIFAGGSTLIIGSVSSATPQSTPTLISIANIGLTSATNPPVTDMFTVNFTDTVTITDGSGTGRIAVTGTLDFTRSDSGGEVSTYTTTASSFSTTIGGVVYTLSNITYSAPTVNNSAGTGSISALVSSKAVPEPASLTMLALGLSGLGLARVRRRLAK